MKLKQFIISLVAFLCAIGFATGCSMNQTEEKTKEEEVKGNCTITECMKQIKASNTIEEINEIIGFESTTDAMIGSDPIWKFDSKNWITFKTYGEDVTIQATIDKETIKNENVTLPTKTELQELLNKDSFTYEEFVEKVGAEGTLESISASSISYVWADQTGQRLGATFNNKSKKCSVASYR